MKKKYNFITKLKICLYWLFRHGEAITVHCHYCKSTKLTFTNYRQDENVYVSKYTCRNCGAKAYNREVWEKKQ